MSRVIACLLAHGRADYLAAARQAVLSVLERTDLDVLLALGEGAAVALPRSPRLSTLRVDPPGRAARPFRFLLKFDALTACLERTDADTVLLLDVDTVVAAPTSAADVEAALGDHGLAMVEQTTLAGTGWERADLLRHYVDHAIALLAPDAPVPQPDDFRFFNTGVLLARRAALESFLPWARETMAAAGDHEVGEHMIADQDYVQVWANSLRPGAAASLPWSWNHCEHWDDSFPRDGARILHFSNHCLGPGRRVPARMALARRAARGGPSAPLWWWAVRRTAVRS